MTVIDVNHYFPIGNFIVPTSDRLKPASGEFADLLMLPLNSEIETSA